MGISFFLLFQNNGFPVDCGSVQIPNFKIRIYTDCDFNEEILSIKFFNRTIVSIFV